jgi:hypothetical protein
MWWRFRPLNHNFFRHTGFFGTQGMDVSRIVALACLRVSFACDVRYNAYITLSPPLLDKSGFLNSIHLSPFSGTYRPEAETAECLWNLSHK